jgi:zinc transport system substrate-binding protein
MTIIHHMRISTVLLATAALAFGAGCGSAPAGKARTNVVAAFYPLAFAAERIGGKTVSVDNLTPAGAEPHDIELTPRDVVQIDDADVLLYLGNGFQPAVEQAARDSHATKIDGLQGIALRQRPDGDTEGPALDPHVWLDPTLYARVAGTIGKRLGRDPGPFRRRLAALDGDYRRGLATCKRRVFVTSHAAFGYLAARYELTQIAISGLQPEAEPSARRLASLSRLVARRHVTTVFFESLVSPKLAETVAREAGAKTAVLNPIEGLTKDQERRGEDYFSLMRENLAALRAALACR